MVSAVGRPRPHWLNASDVALVAKLKKSFPPFFDKWQPATILKSECFTVRKKCCGFFFGDVLARQNFAKVIFVILFVMSLLVFAYFCFHSRGGGKVSVGQVKWSLRGCGRLSSSRSVPKLCFLIPRKKVCLFFFIIWPRRRFWTERSVKSYQYVFEVLSEKEIVIIICWSQ